MTKLQHKHAGIILAAGASSRMGQPKALLETPSGQPLVLHQAGLLQEVGVEDVVVVLGKDGEAIAAHITEDSVRIAQNPEWESGRVSSLQAGIQHVKDAEGVVILPVDTIGIRPATIESLLRFIAITPAVAVRPVHAGSAGKMLWISTQLFDDIRQIRPNEEFRLDDWIAGMVIRFEVDDPAILNNVNTPEEWNIIKEKYPL